MATALIDVTIPDIENDEVEPFLARTRLLLKAEFGETCEVELNGDTEYDPKDTEPETT